MSFVVQDPSFTTTQRRFVDLGRFSFAINQEGAPIDTNFEPAQEPGKFALEPTMSLGRDRWHNFTTSTKNVKRRLQSNSHYD